MRVVSNNSEKDIAREHAKRRVQRASRELAANVLRVTRGAGKPYEIGPQAVALIEAMQAFYDIVGWYPVDEIDAALELSRSDDWLSSAPEEEVARYYAERSVVAGALQVAASQLLGQRTQESAGHGQMYRGINEISDLNAENRRRVLEASKATRQSDRQAEALRLALAKSRAKEKRDRSR